MRDKPVLRVLLSIAILAFTEGFISKIADNPGVIFLLPILFVILAFIISFIMR